MNNVNGINGIDSGNDTKWNSMIITLVVLLVIFILCQMSSAWVSDTIDAVVYAPINYVWKILSGFTIGQGQRTFPNSMIDANPDGMYKHMILAVSDVKMDADQMFMINYSGDKRFPHVFDSEKEREQVREEARAYFKAQYGLSDTFLDLATFELTVNPKIGYRAYYDQDTKKYNQKMVDGGYTVYVPPLTLLGGKYGGKDGVMITRSGVLAYGHYKVFDDDDKLQYKVVYSSPCPLQEISRYDADYTPIDCDVEIIQAPNKDFIGLKGKAQGLNRNIKISGPEKNHIMIRNVMVFYNDKKALKGDKKASNKKVSKKDEKEN